MHAGGIYQRPGKAASLFSVQRVSCQPAASHELEEGGSLHAPYAGCYRHGGISPSGQPAPCPLSLFRLNREAGRLPVFSVLELEALLLPAALLSRLPAPLGERER